MRWSAASRRFRQLGEGLDPRGGIAERAAAALDEVLQFLVAESLEEGRALERPDLRPDAGGLEVVDRRLRHVDERRVDEVVAGVEAVRVPGLGQEPSGAGGIIRVTRRLPVEVEARGDDARRDPRVAQIFRLVDRLPVDGVVRRQTHAPVVPG